MTTTHDDYPHPVPPIGDIAEALAGIHAVPVAPLRVFWGQLRQPIVACPEVSGRF